MSAQSPHTASQTISTQASLVSQMLLPLLKGIIKLCIKRSIKIQEFEELVKAVFIEESIHELQRNNESVSTSKLAIMTGLHRRDVERLRKGEIEKGGKDVLTRILGQWKNDKRFIYKPGKPKPLTFSSSTGDFVELVHCVSRELNPYTILFELERLEFVKKEGELVSLVVDEYVPKENIEEAFRLLGKDVHTLINAVDNNVFSKQETPHLHLTTTYDNIPPQYLSQIKTWILNEGSKLHSRARNYISKFDSDLNPKLKKLPGRASVEFGSFSFTDIIKEEKNETE